MGAEREGRGDVSPPKRKRNTDPGVGPDSDPSINTFRTPPKSTIEDPRRSGPPAGGPPAGAVGRADGSGPNVSAASNAKSHANANANANANDPPANTTTAYVTGPSTSEEEGASADVVDFDALHAALGDLPPPPTSSSPTVGESQGRSSATYASARPHTIPPTLAPSDDLNAPSIIVADSPDTVPTGAPLKMTIPMTQGVVASAPFASQPVRPPAQSSPADYEYERSTPQPFHASAIPMQPDGAGGGGGGNVNVTMHMPNRPRRPRALTVVVRARGPTKQQKLLVFMAMLLLFVGAGIAVLIYLPMSSPPATAPQRPSTGMPSAAITLSATNATMANPVASTPPTASSVTGPTASPPGSLRGGWRKPPLRSP